MNSWYTAQELAGLPGLPTTPRAIRSLAQRTGWSSQRRIGSKASEYAFASLPAETQQSLLSKTVGAANSPEVIERDANFSSRLNDTQRSIMIARLAFIREVEHLSKVTSQRRAIATLLEQIHTGELSLYLAERLERANDRKTSDRNLSERTLKRWLADYKQHGEAGLAPARRKAEVNVPEWAADFLRCYQRPTKPSVEASYAEFAGKHSGERPSIHQVRRFLNKLSVDARELGRCSTQEAKAHKPFNRRNTLNMLPGEVYTADGHTFDAEVLNPRTGKPYRPEITTVIDVATRRALGFSVGEAESHIVVLDALRDAVQRGGMFVMFYVDNGPGYKSGTVREVVERLGGSMVHALPYNSQARGLIERAHQTIWVNAAKKLPSYLGADMDRHAGHKVHKITRRQLRDFGSTSLMPTFDEFRAGAEAEIEAYNRKPHRGLPKIRDPQTFQRRHMTPLEAWDVAIAKGWEPLKAPPEVVHDLFRPQIVRKTMRGEIAWAGERYALDALADLHGKQVWVAYDVRDASRVWVRTMSGELIGEARLNGNASDYIAPSIVEQGYAKQAKGQFKKTVAKLENLTGQRVELVSEPVIDYSQEELAAARQHAARLAAPTPDPFKVPGDAMSRYRLWQRLDARLQAGEVITDEEALWHQRYPKHPDFQAIRRVFEHTMPAR
ncbi:transposase [Pseudomonas cavernae]|uniref:Transposase n=1 Tax=Pseudomonas cavernae TaxID=2320867 RepID=A0A385Z445_9PSED|nr:Mu transposase C-terminal domain-containing protein [Pseudomonas cavernae]AYC32733.1 transposase [Pseudomonas cavernae]